jgi:hypothetical protein
LSHPESDAKTTESSPGVPGCVSRLLGHGHPHARLLVLDGAAEDQRPDESSEHTGCRSSYAQAILLWLTSMIFRLDRWGLGGGCIGGLGAIARGGEEVEDREAVPARNLPPRRRRTAASSTTGPPLPGPVIPFSLSHGTEKIRNQRVSNLPVAVWCNFSQI